MWGRSRRLGWGRGAEYGEGDTRVAGDNVQSSHGGSEVSEQC